MSEHRLSDERLAWLAIRDEVGRQTKPSVIMRIIGAFTPNASGHEARELSDEKRIKYTFAVDDAARELKPEERQTLRLTGQLPAWFLPDVQRRVKQG